jgi:Zn-dependent protease with chaperone function
VSIAACLVVYSFAVAVLGPPLLRRMTRGGDAPRLGVAGWLTAIGSVLVSWLAAASFLIADVASHWNQPLVSCLAMLGGVAMGDVGIAPQLLLLALSAIGAASAAVVVVRVTRSLARMRTSSHDHAQSVRLVGHRTDVEDVVVVEATKPAAYCVTGRPPAIVITTAALAALDDGQLRAVLAHERAHLAGRHPHAVAALRGLATAFPKLALMTDGAEQVSRLLEMCADDAAARRHGRRALLSGLVALSGAAPAGALGAADLAIVARAERLAIPSKYLGRARARAALTSTVTAMAVGPLIIAGLAGSGLLMCGVY